MNTCSVCKHKKRAQIEAALARGESMRKIAESCGASKDAIRRHQECIPDELREARKSRELQSAHNIVEQRNRALALLDKLLDAYDDYLVDPEDHNKYFIGPRASDVEIVYETKVKGGKVIRAKATLGALIQRIEASPRMRGAVVQAVTIKTADPRDLILKTVDRLDRLAARLEAMGPTGQPPLERQVDLIPIEIEAAREEGEEITQEEAARRVRADTDRLVRLARKTGQGDLVSQWTVH